MPRFMVPVTIVGTIEITANSIRDVTTTLDEMDVDQLMGEMNIDDTRYGAPVELKD